MCKIDNFRGSYFFLSNFYNARIKINGTTYLNNEAAFQSFKLRNPLQRLTFSNLSASDAKSKGRHVTLREDWETVKLDVMYEVVKAKFTQNEELKIKFLDTGDSILEEGNTWRDTFWGTVNGRGQNNLGKILMRVREELTNDSE